MRAGEKSVGAPLATLIIVTHELDVFAYRDAAGALDSRYLLFDVLQHLQSLGHRCRVWAGLDPPPGDVALLHVDCTLVPPDYLALGGRYARTINFGTGDISKRKVSRLLLAKGDSWDGPVIVKYDRNRGGRPEQAHNRRAARRGLPPPHALLTRLEPYQTFDGIDEVGDALWEDPQLVVERFIPEPDPDGFAMRTWVFMGARERCTRFVTPSAISKAADVSRYEPMPVPDALRAERTRLAFDYGKFDFVMHNGEPVLLDANRTPGSAVAIQELMKKGARNLAEGLHAMIEGEKVS